jgi:putative ABC transport system permease protein
MTLTSWLLIALREFKGSAGRLLFFAACLSVGVAAVVAVESLSRALDEGIQGQAKQLLAADLAISSRRPIPDDMVAAVEAMASAQWTRKSELPSVVSVPGGGNTPGSSLLCELKAVGAEYPFYGELVTDPSRPISESLNPQTVLVDPELLTRLGIGVGDVLRIGDSLFEIAGTVVSEPDRLGASFAIGPRVLLSTEGLARSGLTGVGSRVEYNLLVKLRADAGQEEVVAAAQTLRNVNKDPGFIRIETYAEAQPNLRRGLGRVGRFLGLVALVSLLVGGIGVAQAVRAWLAGRLDAIAVLRAIGVRPREVFGLFLGQTIVLALAGSLAGGVIGTLVAKAVPGLLAELLPVGVQVGWQPEAMVRGIALGIGVAVLFALRPLIDVLRVPPLRVLRRDADPLPVSRLAAAGLSAVLAVGIATAATLQSGSLARGLQFAIGMSVATSLLALGAWLVMRAVGNVPRDVATVFLRHGLAALARPGSGTLGAVVALGLGVLTVLGMYLIQGRLTAQLDAELPDEAPTAFLIDIQPEQWDGVRSVLQEAGAQDLQSVEVVMARLQSINGAPISELVETADQSSRDRRWVLTREQRLTSMETLPEDNVILDGALWSMPERAEVSVEREFAEDLGVGVGDTLVLNVQGVPLELVVSTIRSVEWGRFSINFFLVVEPGVLDRAPGFRIASARLPAEVEVATQDRLAAAFPNVTMLRLREVLQKVVGILRQLGFGVRFIGAFTVLAGIAILGGSVAAGAVRRGRQVALYKTLGMKRAEVVTVFAVEYALIGFVAGVIGTVGGVLLAYLVTRFGFEIAWAWSPAVLLSAVVLTVALSVAAGLAASTRALAARPLAVLRRVE